MKLQRLKKAQVKDKHIFSRLTTEADTKLQTLSDDYGLPKSTLVRVAVDEFLIKHLS